RESDRTNQAARDPRGRGRSDCVGLAPLGLSFPPLPRRRGRGGKERRTVMDQLWAPWRLAYIASPKPPGADEECFICKWLAAQDDRANLVALRGPRTVVVLNRFPYNNGHLLVAPKAHKGQLHELDDGEALELQQTLARLVQALNEVMHPDGYNVGLNLGRV